MKEKKERNKTEAYVLVLFQFTGLFGMMFTGPLMASGLVLLLLQIFAILLGVWAIIIMRIGNFNITPIPAKHGQLRTAGPYRLIRHPMYTSLLLFTIPELINSYTHFRFFVLLFLLLSLILKMNYEEARLKEEFREYEDYMKNIKRLLPYIY